MMLMGSDKCKKENATWFGSLPKHWKVVRNKNIFYEVAKLSKTGNETLLTVSHITGVTPRSEKNVNMFFAETMEGYKICKPGDLIINTMWAWMGALGTSKHHGICSPAYNVYRKIATIPYNPEYFEYLFRTQNSIIEMTRFSKGIVSSRLRLYPKDFNQILSPLPPIEDQNAIANYLKPIVAKIDDKISLIKEKIRIYSELRVSLISEVVCKGLNKNVSFKKVNTNWVESIPKHWTVGRIKDGFYLHTGNSISDKCLHEINNNSRSYVATKDIDIETGIINYDNGIYISKSEKGFKIAKASSTLICIEGGSAGKKIAFTNRDICFVNKLCAVKSIKRSYKDRYFYYFTMTEIFQNQFHSILNGLIGGVSLNSIKYFDIILPPEQEQIEISRYLDNKIETIDSIIINIEQQIEKLNELRKTLINNVVTGKIKVTK